LLVLRAPLWRRCVLRLLVLMAVLAVVDGERSSYSSEIDLLPFSLSPPVALPPPRIGYASVRARKSQRRGGE